MKNATFILLTTCLLFGGVSLRAQDGSYEKPYDLGSFSSASKYLLMDFQKIRYQANYVYSVHYKFKTSTQAYMAVDDYGATGGIVIDCVLYNNQRQKIARFAGNDSTTSVANFGLMPADSYYLKLDIRCTDTKMTADTEKWVEKVLIVNASPAGSNRMLAFTLDPEYKKHHSARLIEAPTAWYYVFMPGWHQQYVTVHTDLTADPELYTRLVLLDEFMDEIAWSEESQRKGKILNQPVDPPTAFVKIEAYYKDASGKEVYKDCELTTSLYISDNPMPDPSPQFAELVFTYDKAGNRIARNTVVLAQAATVQTDAYPPYGIQQEELEAFTAKIYPNPTRGQLAVEILDYEGELNGFIRIFDIEGNLQLQESLTQTMTTLDISNCRPGLYIMHIQLAGKVSTWRIIKQ